jgi:transcriptional regulator with XRE-family HTH domain
MLIKIRFKEVLQMPELRLKDFRKKANMSQRDVARAMNITQAYYCYWEKEINYPNAKQIKQLCEIFDCTPNDLLGIKEKYSDAMNKLDQ